MSQRVWPIRIFKTANGWRACAPIYGETFRGKPTLTTKVNYKGAVLETPGGTWQIEWCESGKRKRLKCGPNTSDVLKALDRKMLELQAQAAGLVMAPNAPGKRLVKDAVDDFLKEQQRSKAHKTWQAHKANLDLFQQVAPRYVEDIKRSDVTDKFIGKLQEQGLALRTQNHRVCCLLAFLKFTGVVTQPPLTLKDAPKYTDDGIRCYTQADLDALFAACDPQEELLFRFFLNSGAREQEVMYAEANDLLHDCKTFLIQAKPQYGFQPKGRKNREVPLPDDLATKLREHVKTLKGTLLFPHQNGRPDGHLLRRLKAVVERANLKATYGKWTLHLFRHTFCTMHLRGGVDVYTVMRWAGHEDMSTTQQYLDWLSAHSTEARTAVNRSFAPPVPTLQLAPVK